MCFLQAHTTAAEEVELGWCSFLRCCTCTIRVSRALPTYNKRKKMKYSSCSQLQQFAATSRLPLLVPSDSQSCLSLAILPPGSCVRKLQTQDEMPDLSGGADASAGLTDEEAEQRLAETVRLQP